MIKNICPCVIVLTRKVIASFLCVEVSKEEKLFLLFKLEVRVSSRISYLFYNFILTSLVSMIGRLRCWKIGKLDSQVFYVFQTWNTSSNFLVNLRLINSASYHQHQCFYTFVELLFFLLFYNFFGVACSIKLPLFFCYIFSHRVVVPSSF